MGYENFSTWRNGVQNPSNGDSRKSGGGGWFKHSLITVIVVAVLVGGGYGGWWYMQRYRPHQQAKAAGVGDSQTVSQVIEKVGKHLVLPTGEQPTMATVSDISKVKGQAFFANAANGDKVLVYAQAKKAILYRPSIDRIIETAPLSADTPSTGVPANRP